MLTGSGGSAGQGCVASGLQQQQKEEEGESSSSQLSSSSYAFTRRVTYLLCISFASRALSVSTVVVPLRPLASRLAAG